MKKVIRILNLIMLSHVGLFSYWWLIYYDDNVIKNNLFYYDYKPVGINKNNNSRKKGQQQQQRPLAVVHVGPHKTGSSTIQTFLKNHKKVIQEKDHYWVPTFPGKWKEHWSKNTANLATCLHHDDVKDMCILEDGTNIKTTLVEFVEKISNKNNNNISSSSSSSSSSSNNISTNSSKINHNLPNNIVMSSEEFDNYKTDIGWLKKELEPRFKVRIVLYYRCFYQWLVSRYNEISKRRLNGGRDVPSIVEWLSQKTLNENARSHTYEVYKRYSDYFPAKALTVLNFDDHSVSLEESFFCRALPEATHTCQMTKIKNNRKVVNARVNLDWLRIKIGLRARSYPEQKIKKQTLELQTQLKILLELEEADNKETNTTGTAAVLWMNGDPPPTNFQAAVIRRKCLSQTMLDQIFNMSSFFEEGLRDVLPRVPNQTVVPPSIMDVSYFHKQIPQSFCTLDIERLIDHWEQQAFFKTSFLNAGIIPVLLNNNDDDRYE